MGNAVGSAGTSPMSRAPPSAWALPCAAAPVAAARTDGPSRARQAQSELRSSGGASGLEPSEKGTKKPRRAEGQSADQAVWQASLENRQSAASCASS
eukprot:8270148-Alexandrium_andersonii.AAC.1